MDKRTQDTIRLQKALNREGFLVKVDGIPGPATSAALMAFQEKARNQPDGLDVSKWNADVNWLEVAKAGIKFAYCKATDGYSLDPKFSKNWAGIKAAGLLRGAYGWFHPSLDVERQAQTIVHAIGVLGLGDLPFWIDSERDDKGADGELGTKDDIRITDPMLEVFAARVAELTGKSVCIYGYGYYLDDRDLEISKAGLAIADYRSGPPTLPPGYPKHTFHQYLGDEGRAPGVNGPCDRVRFNGSWGELRTLAGY
jgi:lysozyme